MHACACVTRGRIVFIVRACLCGLARRMPQHVERPGTNARALVLSVVSLGACNFFEAPPGAVAQRDHTQTACSNVVERAAGLQATCCPNGLLSCPASIPTSCDTACAQSLLGFVGDCKESFGAEALSPAIDPVLAVCAAASGESDSPAEVGGGAVNHFVNDHLEGCSNLAEGHPAAQASVAYDGAASNAVDGNGLDGSWGSGSCTHTDGNGPTWWQVDLGEVKDIRAVQLVNRADCCQDVSMEPCRSAYARCMNPSLGDSALTRFTPCGTLLSAAAGRRPSDS